MIEKGYEADYFDVIQAKDEITDIYRETKLFRQQETLDRIEDKKGKQMYIGVVIAQRVSRFSRSSM